jgi:hypothetical protein
MSILKELTNVSGGETIRDQITPEDEEKLDQAIDQAVQEVRADTNNAYGKDSA